MAERISSFKDLRVYKLAFELQQEVFATSKHFPSEERYALTDQVRRASDSCNRCNSFNLVTIQRSESLWLK